jgi:hypothetical protein
LEYSAREARVRRRTPGGRRWFFGSQKANGGFRAKDLNFGRLSRQSISNHFHSTGRCVYRCEVKSVEEFIRRIAVDLVPRGYVFYVQGEIPEGKEPATTDAKIIQQYGISISKWARARQKQKGIARLHYLRLDRTFVILATLAPTISSPSSCETFATSE